MKLSELVTISEIETSAQDTLVRKFGISSGDSQDVLDFVENDLDWEELSDEVREKLYAWAEKDSRSGFTKLNNSVPGDFIRSALVAYLGLTE